MTRTRVMVLSDTHGEDLDYSQLPAVDVAIHCGDLTEESKLSEFETAVNVLRRLPASIKLVIAGNYDFTLDNPMFQEKVATAQSLFDPALVRQTYGDFGAAERLLCGEDNPLYCLKERLGLFVYNPEIDHGWDIQPNRDIVITHGPPRGLLDYTEARERAGSPSLYAAVASTRPKLHCFGHIHEGWGAKLVHWRPVPEDTTPSHFTAVDNDKSEVAETLGTLTRGKFDSLEVTEAKELTPKAYSLKDYCEAEA